MFFYILLTFTACWLLFHSFYVLRVGRVKIKIEEVAFGVIVLVSLLRFDVGWDYVNYYKIASTYDIWAMQRFEPLSKLLLTVSAIFGYPQLTFWLFGIPTYYLIYKTVKRYSVSLRFSIVLYISFFYLESLGFIRQSLAVAICFYAVRFVFERNFVRYLLLVLVACLCHFSAIVALVIYPLYGRVRIHHLIWAIPALYLFKKIALMLLSRIGLYTSYLEELDTMIGGALIRIFYIMLFFSLFVSKCKNFSVQEHFLLFVIGLSTFFPFLFGSHLGVRLSSYFFMFFIILIPSLVRNLKLKCLYAFLCLSFFLLTLYWTTNDPIKSQYIPYQFYFQVDDPTFR